MGVSCEDSPFLFSNMNEKATIEAYTFSIRKKREKEYLSFSEYPDIYQILAHDTVSFIKYIDKNITGNVPTEKMTVRIPKTGHTHNDSERCLCGIIETGHYGKEYEAVDKDDPRDEEKKVYLGKSKAIMKPFFYYIQIPRKGNKALIILERTENNGIFPLMRSILTAFFNNHFGIEENGYIIDRGNIILGSYLKKLSDGCYNSLSLSANSVPADVTERYFGVLNSEDFTLELTMKFKKGIGAVKEKKIKEMIDSGVCLFESPELSTIFENSTKKVTSTIGEGKGSTTRTLYLDDEKRNLIHPYYEIDIKENDKGFSDYESIKDATKKFIKENTDFRVFD